MFYLSKVGRGSDDMIELIEKTMIKHRKGLTPGTISVIETRSELNATSESRG